MYMQEAAKIHCNLLSLLELELKQEVNLKVNFYWPKK